MSNPTPKPGTVALTLRRIARGWSIASIGFVLLIFLGEVIFPHAEGPFRLRDLVLFVFFPIGTCAGMILGWRWEGLGGTITIGSLLAFYAALRIMDGRFPGGPFFALVAAPGLLFLLSWTLGIARMKDNTA
jgi:hypothetical protein